MSSADAPSAPPLPADAAAMAALDSAASLGAAVVVSGLPPDATAAAVGDLLAALAPVVASALLPGGSGACGVALESAEDVESLLDLASTNPLVMAGRPLRLARAEAPAPAVAQEAPVFDPAAAAAVTDAAAAAAAASVDAPPPAAMPGRGLVTYYDL